MATEKFSIMILNGSGPHDGRGSTLRRRHAIYDVVTNWHPDLIFVQELGVKKIQGNAWKDKEKDEDYSLQAKYMYTGDEDRGIIYNKDRVSLNSKADVYEAVEAALDEYCYRGDSSVTLEKSFRRISLSENGDDVYNPRDRMCARWFTLKSTKGEADIICISWHGRSNNSGGGGAMSNEKKKKLFKRYMQFLLEVKEDFKLPFIIAGDYNIEKEIIEDYLPDHFYLDEYHQGGRRENNPIDYFITHRVKVKKVHGLHWKKETNAEDPNEVLDHDPIIGEINIEDLKSYKENSDRRYERYKKASCII